MHQADFFGYVEYGQFVIFTSSVLENICHHFSPSSTDQPPERKSHEESITVISTLKKTPPFSAENCSSKRPGTPRPGVFPEFFCFRPVFSERLERVRSERHEVFHIDALHVHFWWIKLDGSYRSIDEYWCLCCWMMAGWVRGFQP